ncbi:unnamed protein product, partial [Symbiodinium pilosum]
MTDQPTSSTRIGYPATTAARVLGPAVPAAVVAGRWPSRGSIGHPELCQRGCIKHAAGQCAAGAACDFCHFRHARDYKLERTDRQLLRRLSRFNLLRITLTLLERRIGARRAQAAAIFQ